MYCTAVHSCVSERGGWRTFTVSPFLRFTTTLAESEGSRKIAARSTAISAVAAAGTATAGEGRRMKKTPAAITARLLFFPVAAAGLGCGAGLSAGGSILGAALAAVAAAGAGGAAGAEGAGGAGKAAACAASGLAAKNEVTSPDTGETDEIGATGEACAGGYCGRGGSAALAGATGA